MNFSPSRLTSSKRPNLHNPMRLQSGPNSSVETAERAQWCGDLTLSANMWISTPFSATTPECYFLLAKKYIQQYRRISLKAVSRLPDACRRTTGFWTLFLLFHSPFLPPSFTLPPSQSLTTPSLSHPSLSSCFLSPENDCGLAMGRSRREKKEKTGRKSALEQLKRAKKGEKVKYEVRCVCVVQVLIWQRSVCVLRF